MAHSEGVDTVETWSVSKPTVTSRSGVVASQHHVASDIGAEVLAAGGNAVDAAVAAGLAIGTVEPWMSGLGGGGCMLVYLADQRGAYAVDFGMRAPRGLDPADYPLSDGADSDLFGWPAVRDDRNVSGPWSFAVPGFVAGMGVALRRFGRLSWREAMGPAVEQARRGLLVDWYATLRIASEAPTLAGFAESARTYLPGGFVPAGKWGGAAPVITLGRLADTLAWLADAGPEDFYGGDLAASLIGDVRDAGGQLVGEDLAACGAACAPVSPAGYRGAKVYAAPALTAGPSLTRALGLLESRWRPGAAIDGEAFGAYAGALLDVYAERLERLGAEGDMAHPGCTTHIGVVDKDGNMVALTQTLLSVFGSKVMLPETGILMNNGVMWFDPRPGRPNSMGPGKRPLANMCPTLVERADGVRFALGASGGRRILPAVCQLLSFLCDFGLPLEAASHHPRIDVSGTSTVTVDARLPADVHGTLADRFTTRRATHAVHPALFGCPNVVGMDVGAGEQSGAAFVMSPSAKVSAVRP